MHKKTFNVLFLGRKHGSVSALEYLLKKKVQVRAVVCPSLLSDGKALRAFAITHRIPFYRDDSVLYKRLRGGRPSLRDIDLVISYLYPKRIRSELIHIAKRGCINFHPAPLPENKGRAGYNTAILENKKQFGVSAHFVDSEKFDVGPIIKVLRFPIRPQKETALSLERLTQGKLLLLFKDVVDMFLRNKKIVTRPNVGGVYLTARDLEKMKEVSRNDLPEDIRRKIRAFFFPPYAGATINIGGTKYTLIDETILDMLAELLESNHSV